MSDAKLAANRNNSKKSTGPKTDEGKRKSAMNAVRHGLCAKTVCVHGEEAEQFNALVTEFAREHRPASSTEYALVYRMAVSSWNLRRLTEAETSMIDAATFHRAFENGKWVEKRLSIGEAMLKVMKDDKRFNSLQIYQQRLERAFYRALNELRRVRKERLERDEEIDDVVETMSFAGMGLGEEKREQARGYAGDADDPTVVSTVDANRNEQTNPPRSQVIDVKAVTESSGAEDKPKPQVPAPPKRSISVVDKIYSNMRRAALGLPRLYPEVAQECTAR